MEQDHPSPGPLRLILPAPVVGDPSRLPYTAKFERFGMPFAGTDCMHFVWQVPATEQQERFMTGHRRFPAGSQPAWFSDDGAARRRGCIRAVPAASQEPQVLNYLSWPGNSDPYLVADFEKENNCKIQIKNMLAATRCSPSSTIPSRLVRCGPGRRGVHASAQGSGLSRGTRSRRLSASGLLARIPEVSAPLVR